MSFVFISLISEDCSGDKIIVLSGGEVTAVGTKDEVMPKLIESSEACSTLLDKLA